MGVLPQTTTLVRTELSKVGRVFKSQRVSRSQGLGILLGAVTFSCFFLAGLSESTFTMWLDGAGVSFLIYGLVRAGGWLISGRQTAKDDLVISRTSEQESDAQDTTPAFILQERIEQIEGRPTEPKSAGRP